VKRYIKDLAVRVEVEIVEAGALAEYTRMGVKARYGACWI